MADDRAPLNDGRPPGPADRAVGMLRRGLAWAIGVVAAAAVLGLVLLWPRGPAPDLGAQPNTFVDATVTSARQGTCPAVEIDAPTRCTTYAVRVTSGPDAGDAGEFVVRDIDFGVPELHRGDAVVLLDVVTSPPPYRYTFSDMQRAASLWWLVGLFAVAVVAFGRWQGVRALVGLGVSGVIVVAFVVPALLRDGPAVWIALTGTVVIAVAALYLAHGVNTATTVALAGTVASLLLITLGALAFARLASLTGLADEESTVLRVTASALDLRGLLVAGIVIGALGVLDDVTVTQVSTVVALWRAAPGSSRRQVYRSALRVGRDHVASTVNTLVLAYVGAALPLVLLFTQGNAPVSRVLTREVIAAELVRMLVGSIGLVASVPITTAIAAAVLGPDDVAGGHDHGPLDHVTHARTVAEDASPEMSHPPRWEDFGPRA